MGIRKYQARAIELSPVTRHSARSPDAAWASVAPTAWRPAITRANEVANPVIEATIPAEMGCRMGYRSFSCGAGMLQPSLGREHLLEHAPR
jgi:hypothetical protein